MVINLIDKSGRDLKKLGRGPSGGDGVGPHRTAVTRLFLAGFTMREIRETMGWAELQAERTIDTYGKRDEIALARIAKLDENTDRTNSAKPDPKSGIDEY